MWIKEKGNTKWHRVVDADAAVYNTACGRVILSAQVAGLRRDEPEGKHCKVCEEVT